MQRGVRGRKTLRAAVVMLMAAAVMLLVGASSGQAHLRGDRNARHGRGPAPLPPIVVRLDQSAMSLVAGETARLTVRWPSLVTAEHPVAQLTGLPGGVTVETERRRGDHTFLVLVIRTGRSLRAGEYALVVTVTLGRRTGSAPLQLTVRDRNQPMRVTGDLTGLLTPGSSLPLDLTLDNPNGEVVRLSRLSVSVIGIDPAHAGCAVGPNFAVRQFSGSYRTLRIPARSSRRLSQVVSRSAWPRVAMVETGRNQNACKGARLTLQYEATVEGEGRGAHR